MLAGAALLSAGRSPHRSVPRRGAWRFHYRRSRQRRRRALRRAQRRRADRSATATTSGHVHGAVPAVRIPQQLRPETFVAAMKRVEAAVRF